MFLVCSCKKQFFFYQEVDTPVKYLVTGAYYTEERFLGYLVSADSYVHSLLSDTTLYSSIPISLLEIILTKTVLQEAMIQAFLPSLLICVHGIDDSFIRRH